MEWYQRQGDDVCDQLQSSHNGMSEAQVIKKREEDGENVLQEGAKRSLLLVFLDQFKDLLVIVLILAALISYFSGEQTSAIVILFVITMNAILGTVQYHKAEKSIQALKAMASPMVKVKREGQIKELNAIDLVCGDLILLEAGDMVPADGRILYCSLFQTNESALTGEVTAIEKTSDVLVGQLPLGDRKNMVFSGSFITNGRAEVIVTATGMRSELGKIAAMMNEVKQTKTPLQISLDEFSKKLSIAILLICAVVFALQMVQGIQVLDALMFAVALAVAAIPEALASIVTIVLAMGAQRMARQHAVMKKLYSVETLGSVNVICSDKTGTLTQNKMQVTDVYLCEGSTPTPTSQAYQYFLHACALCVDASVSENQRIGDPTELALVDYALAQQIDPKEWNKRYPRIDELPFDSERKEMTTLHQIDGEYVMLVKGAPDVLLRDATQRLCADHIEKLDDAKKAEIAHKQKAFANQGKRVLGFAYRILNHASLTDEDETDFIFLGLAALMDPPRAESAEAVRLCHQAGIETVMITGDHKDTALAIATQVGMCTDTRSKCVDGIQLDQMSDEDLERQLPQIAVFARVAPKHKQRIIQAFQKGGAITAMTGDGVNDAPALKRADIGVAMGITGTEVSKDAADMILMDDNFATIVSAVASGRAMVANIKHAIGYLLSGNFSAILCVLLASLLSLAVPFLPIHLLFINLITDSLPAIAIGVEPSVRDVLKEQPRDPKKSILDRDLMISIGFQGCFIACPTMAAYLIGSQTSVQCAQTMAFAVLCLSRLFHGFTCRQATSIRRFSLLSNPFSLIAFAIGAILLHLILTIPVLEQMFALASLDLIQLSWIWGLSFVSFAFIQLVRMLREHRQA